MGFADLIATADAAVLEHLGGVPVIYQPEVGDPVTTGADGNPLTGIFDENYVLTEAGENGVENIGPAVSLRLADIAPHDPEDDEPTITIGGRSYRVRERQPDSVRGMVVLLLHRSDL